MENEQLEKVRELIEQEIEHSIDCEGINKNNEYALYWRGYKDAMKIVRLELRGKPVI